MAGKASTKRLVRKMMQPRSKGILDGAAEAATTPACVPAISARREQNTHTTLLKQG